MSLVLSFDSSNQLSGRQDPPLSGHFLATAALYQSPRRSQSSNVELAKTAALLSKSALVGGL